MLLTHIVRSDDRTRQQQLRETIDRYLALPEPSIFLGDLNSEVTDPEVRRLLAAPDVVDAVGQKLGSRAPPRIDRSSSAACGCWMPGCATTGLPTIPWPGRS